MRITDLTPLKNNDAEFEKLAASVSEYYKCEWDDAVHDSYSVYVKQTEERRRLIREIRCKAEELTKETERLKIGDLINKTAKLCREAENI